MGKTMLMLLVSLSQVAEGICMLAAAIGKMLPPGMMEMMLPMLTPAGIKGLLSMMLGFMNPETLGGMISWLTEPGVLAGLLGTMVQMIGGMFGTMF